MAEGARLESVYTRKRIEVRTPPSPPNNKPRPLWLGFFFCINELFALVTYLYQKLVYIKN